MKTKALISLFLSALLILTCFVACDKPQTPNDDDNGSSVPTNTFPTVSDTESGNDDLIDDGDDLDDGSGTGSNASGNASSTNQNGNTSSDNTSSGNTSSGNTSSGNTSSNAQNGTSSNTSSGNTSSGNTSSGNTSSDNTSSGNTSSGNGIQIGAPEGALPPV